MCAVDWERDYERAQQARAANVICMKWGTLYGPEWVNKLYAGVARNTTWKVRFVCLTDDSTGIRSEVECLPLPPLDLSTGGASVRRGVVHGSERASDPWWNKMSAFRETLYDLSGMTLYLDLDVVVVSNIDAMFTHPGRFCMMRIWRAERFSEAIGNSSVVRYFIGREKGIFEKFAATPFSVVQERYNGSQQRFLSANVEELSFFPQGWCVSFKDCLPRNWFARYFSAPTYPGEAKLVVFYGLHTPQAAINGEMAIAKVKKGLRRRLLMLSKKRFRPAPWVAQHWAE